MNIVLTDIQSLTLDPQISPATDQSGLEDFTHLYRQQFAEVAIESDQMIDFKGLVGVPEGQEGALQSPAQLQIPVHLPIADAWQQTLAGDRIKVSSDLDAVAIQPEPLLSTRINGIEVADSQPAYRLAQGQDLPPAGNSLPTGLAPTQSGLVDTGSMRNIAPEPVALTKEQGANAEPSRLASLVDAKTISPELATQPRPRVRDQLSVEQAIPRQPGVNPEVVKAETSAPVQPNTRDGSLTQEPLRAMDLSYPPGVRDLPPGRTEQVEFTRSVAPQTLEAKVETRTPADKIPTVNLLASNKADTGASIPRVERAPAEIQAAAVTPLDKSMLKGVENQQPHETKILTETDLARQPRAGWKTALQAPVISAEPIERGFQGQGEIAINQPAGAAGQASLSGNIVQQAITAVQIPTGSSPVVASSTPNPLPTALETMTVPARADSVDWGNGLGERVSWMINQKQNLATIRLDPPTLGKLDVQIRLSDDATTVTIHTQQAQTRDLIESASHRLRDFLQESGYQNVNVDVSQRQDQQQARTPLNDQVDEFDDVSAEAGPESEQGDALTHFRSDGLLDTFA